MSDKVRGRVLIFNTMTMIRDGQYTERRGSDRDYSNICRLFKDLKFHIVKSEPELTDLTAQVVFVFSKLVFTFE